MITTKIMNDVKATFERTGYDLELTYNQFKDQLTPNEVYDICINKAEPKNELPKEDLNGNRLNPFTTYSKDEETFEPYSSLKYKAEDNYTNATVEVDANNGKVIDNTDTTITEKDVDVFESNKSESTLNYESVGFAIGFKKATAKDLLKMADGNTLRLIPALQWLYKQTNEEGLRKRIQELTIDVLFN